ncbi:MAG: protein tyrosine phosphatase family protein [Acidobacteriota bacterium]|jgi:uncharacterized protein (TIGR01244 family)
MRHWFRLFMLAALLLAVPAVLCAQAQPAVQEQQKPSLPNYVELSSRIGTGGQPTDAGMKQLAEKGYKRIINLRTSGEGVDLAAEERQAMQLGLRYYMVPFNAKEPTEEQALAFSALMSALKEDKVFVHCGSGNRAGSLMMIYLALEEGMPPDKAEQEARKAGLRSSDLLEFAKQVIGRHRK